MAQESDIFDDENAFAQKIYDTANTKYLEEEYDEAQSHFEDLLFRKKSDTRLLPQVPNYNIAYHLGRSLFQLKKYDRALDMLSAFLGAKNVDIDTKPGKYDLCQVHFMLGKICKKRGHSNGNFELAIMHYENYLKIKDEKLVSRLRKIKCNQKCVDLDCAKFLSVLEE